MSGMNALYCDLKHLVEETEQARGSLAVEDPYCLHFHLMPPVGWMNDPNGLGYCDGWYHVFYQYSPFNPEGGVKVWGHYRSRDLLCWEKLPVMLYPDQPWDVHGVYSGSALVEDGVLYLYYTGNIKYMGEFDYITDGRESNTALAISRDGIKICSNELLMKNCHYPQGLTSHVRDPKVWAQDGRYYMVQGARTSDNQGVVLVFESEDKHHWNYINMLKFPETFGYMWECPDLFELDGQWFLLCSPQGVERQGDRYQNKYTSGYFPLYGDFRSRCTLGEYEELDRGFDFYAPQTFWDGHRRLLLGWMGMPDAEYSNPTVKNGWQHCMTVMCELKNDNGKLLRIPVLELDTLHRKKVDLEQAEVFDLSCKTSDAGRIVIRGCAELEWGNGNMRLSLDKDCGAGRTVRYSKTGPIKNLRILADTSSLEIFVNEGKTVLSTRYYPEYGRYGIVSEGIRDISLWEMRALEISEYLKDNY